MNEHLNVFDLTSGNTFNFDGVQETISEKVAKKQSQDASVVENLSLIVKYYETHTDRINHINELINYPEPGTQIRIVTQNSFNAFTFILKLIADFGFISELFLTSYNISQKTLFSLEELITSGKIKSSTLILSESLQFRIPKRAVELSEVFHRNPDKIKIAMIWNHTKIMMAKVKDHHFVMEGSGNLSDNARIEQYIFEDNQQVYEFHASWMNQLFEKKILKRHIIYKQ